MPTFAVVLEAQSKCKDCHGTGTIRRVFGAGGPTQHTRACICSCCIIGFMDDDLNSVVEKIASMANRELVPLPESPMIVTKIPVDISNLTDEEVAEIEKEEG